MLVALAEMALATNIGCVVSFRKPLSDGSPVLRGQSAAKVFFGEDQGRYLVTSGKPVDVIRLAKVHDIPATIIGATKASDEILIGLDDGSVAVRLSDLRAAHEGFFTKLMGSELTPEF